MPLRYFPFHLRLLASWLSPPMLAMQTFNRIPKARLVLEVLHLQGGQTYLPTPCYDRIVAEMDPCVQLRWWSWRGRREARLAWAGVAGEGWSLGIESNPAEDNEEGQYRSTSYAPETSLQASPAPSHLQSASPSPHPQPRARSASFDGHLTSQILQGLATAHTFYEYHFQSPRSSLTESHRRMGLSQGCRSWKHGSEMFGRSAELARRRRKYGQMVLPRDGRHSILALQPTVIVILASAGVQFFFPFPFGPHGGATFSSASYDVFDAVWGCGGMGECRCGKIDHHQRRASRNATVVYCWVWEMEVNVDDGPVYSQDDV
ncbi:hypothetical protein FIBSPDRAFT_482396 [Athelia psychrophila]|uniref:Uncharacterized protein n=1 Tax=Athelia psychrophila TaxID=1759441 RepID=A0A166KZT0_9AGAM|nr:hypothetical protein FIBSPDRAFT_482396 [Fibularhizoctonia sp. CBS 109695]